MARPLIVFDMDGVLVDVTESYRETIRRTVAHFCGLDLTPAQIQDYKNQGGFNDDWKLSHHVITGHGVAVEFQTVVDYFQSLFHGNGTDGLILRERWIATRGLFERLAARLDLDECRSGRTGPQERARVMFLLESLTHFIFYEQPGIAV